MYYSCTAALFASRRAALTGSGCGNELCFLVIPGNTLSEGRLPGLVFKSPTKKGDRHRKRFSLRSMLLLSSHYCSGKARLGSGGPDQERRASTHISRVDIDIDRHRHR